MSLNSNRAEWLAAFLWISVIAWSVALGGKLFEIVVVMSSWASNPPESLALMPYGPRYPFNPGDFFQPLGLVALVGCVGSLYCGWYAPRQYRALLWVQAAVLLLTAVATPTLFWPIITDLYRAGTGTAPLPDVAVHALVTKWYWYDGIRTVLGVLALVCSLHALSTRYRVLGV